MNSEQIKHNYMVEVSVIPETEVKSPFTGWYKCRGKFPGDAIMIESLAKTEEEAVVKWYSFAKELEEI